MYMYYVCSTSQKNPVDGAPADTIRWWWNVAQLPWRSRGKFKPEKKCILKKIMLNFREMTTAAGHFYICILHTGKIQISFKTKQSTSMMESLNFTTQYQFFARSNILLKCIINWLSSQWMNNTLLLSQLDK